MQRFTNSYTLPVIVCSLFLLASIDGCEFSVLKKGAPTTQLPFKNGTLKLMLTPGSGDHFLGGLRLNLTHYTDMATSGYIASMSIIMLFDKCNKTVVFEDYYTEKSTVNTCTISTKDWNSWWQSVEVSVDVDGTVRVGKLEMRNFTVDGNTFLTIEVLNDDRRLLALFCDNDCPILDSPTMNDFNPIEWFLSGKVNIFVKTAGDGSETVTQNTNDSIHPGGYNNDSKTIVINGSELDGEWRRFSLNMKTSMVIGALEKNIKMEMANKWLEVQFFNTEWAFGCKPTMLQEQESISLPCSSRPTSASFLGMKGLQHYSASTHTQ